MEDKSFLRCLIVTFCWKYCLGLTEATGVNLALNKPAYQSSQYLSHSANLATDGDFRSNPVDRCTHTAAAEIGTGEWWVVDLGDTYNIARVSLTSRGDCCGQISHRLVDFYIRVGQTFNQGSFDPTTYTVCRYQDDAFCTGETRMFTCSSPISGRYVTVHFPMTKTEVLTLCEVAVYEYIQKDRKNTYKRYMGPEKGYRTLYQVKAATAIKCMEQCTINLDCEAVKFNQQVNQVCLLLRNQIACETADVMVTDVYERNEN